MLSTLRKLKKSLWCEYGPTYHTVISNEKISILCEGYIREQRKEIKISPIPKELVQYIYQFLS